MTDYASPVRQSATTTPPVVGDTPSSAVEEYPAPDALSDPVPPAAVRTDLVDDGSQPAPYWGTTKIDVDAANATASSVMLEGEYPFPAVFAPGGSVNLGTVHGGQHLRNNPAEAGVASLSVTEREGPIGAEKVLTAQEGFAEPNGFAEALDTLRRSRLLFLVGNPGTGRRTSALNLLARSTASLALHAVDSTEILGNWHPTNNAARGYLADGMSLTQPQHWEIGRLRSRLQEADAYLVVLVEDRPATVHHLRRELQLSPVQHRPPPADQVFDAQLRRVVPDAERRVQLLDGLPPGSLEDLLTPDLLPAQAVELANELADGITDVATFRSRLSFLAEEEVPGLLQHVLGEPDVLTLLLAVCVFEGQDAPTVLTEARRLRSLAGDRLEALLPHTEEGGSARENPAFVVRHSLGEQLRAIGARQCPPEARTTSRFAYTIEPVRFNRRGRAEAVLKHIWREYDELARLLTAWLAELPDEADLAWPAGHVLGLAMHWVGGRRGLSPIGALARSDREATRMVAAHALGVAAEDPALSGQVRDRTAEWSTAVGWQLRATVAYACGAKFGLARPDRALRLLGTLARGRARHQGEDDTPPVDTLNRTMDQALRNLWLAGNDREVLRAMADWDAQGGPAAHVALRTVGRLPVGATRPRWRELLRGDGDGAKVGTELLRRALNDADLFDATARPLLSWCRAAAWDPHQQETVIDLLTALARTMDRGVLRLLVLIDNDDNSHTAARHLAHARLEQWRAGAFAPSPVAAEGDSA